MRIALILVLALLSSVLHSQETGLVSGRILDETMNNEPLVQAMVVLKSTRQVSKTNFHGNFSISGIPAGEDTLVISYPGYETLEIGVAVRKGYEVVVEHTLKVILPDLDEVKWIPADMPPAVTDKAHIGQMEIKGGRN